MHYICLNIWNKEELIEEIIKKEDKVKKKWSSKIPENK